MYIKKIDNEKGQVLLFVTVIMTIALSVGTAISTRTLSSISRVANVDTSNKVLAAAESAIEQYLIKDLSELKTLSDQEPQTIYFESNQNNDLQTISIQNTNDSQDENLITNGITTKAEVIIEDYKTNSVDESGQPNIYFNIEPGNIKEINLKGYQGNLEICYEEADSNLSYVIYNQEGVAKKDILTDSGCNDIDISSDFLSLRLKVLYLSSNVKVTPSNIDSFPAQGYKITSIGTLEQEGKATSSRTVVAYRSLNYLPGVFDYTLYTQEEFYN